MQIDNTTESRESWTPLEKALGPAQCVDFMWMGTVVQLHRSTVCTEPSFPRPRLDSPSWFLSI